MGELSKEVLLKIITEVLIKFVNNLHTNPELLNPTKQITMDKSKIYLDLSKCTEEEIKSLPQIIGLQDSYLIDFMNAGDFTDFYDLHFNKNYWNISKNVEDSAKTEITYPEFIKLFEREEGETKVDIYSGELNTERILTYKKLSEQYNIEESTVRDIFNAGADWVNKLKFK